MNTFFISDTHFGHENIIKLCGRPFKTVEEMNETMIENWNKTVASDDLIYHLGDFAYKSSFGLEKYTKRLNGKKILLLGNHDRYPKHLYKKLFAEVHEYLQIQIKGQKIILFHYPIASWNAAYHGSWHLFGHTHNNSPLALKNTKSKNISVEQINYTPISIEEIEVELQKKHESLSNEVKDEVHL